MKKKIYKGILILFGVILLNSCSKIYQISQTNSKNVVTEDNEYKFENNDLKISYNLWSKGGTLNFIIYNKSDKPIYIDWNSSNFIWNGYSIDYQKNIEITNGIGAGVKYNNNYLYNGFSVSKREKPQIQLPPKSFISVNKFNLDMPFIKSSKRDNFVYSENNTIFKFRNYIAYSFDKDLKELKFIDNDFWTEKIFSVNNKFFKKEYFYKKNFNKDKFYNNQTNLNTFGVIAISLSIVTFYVLIILLH